MRGFEQATSKARCSIIQLHCPVKLKLKRRYKKCFLCSHIFCRIYEGFIFLKRAVFVVDGSHSHNLKLMVAYNESDRLRRPEA